MNRALVLFSRIVLCLGGAVTVSNVSAGTSHWICDDGIYSESSCWDEGIPSDPGESGSIDFDNLEMPYTVTIDVNATFGTLNVSSPEARISITDREVNPAFSFNVVPGAEVTMTDSSFVGETGVYTNGGLLTVRRTNLMDLAGFEQNNLLRIVANGIGGNAELTVNTGFTNHGVMEFQGSCCAGNNAVLVIPGDDWLTNTGGINLLAGPGNHVIDANLDNQGIINLGKTSFFNKSNGQYISSNAVNFGESVVLNIDNAATFSQTDGQINMPASSRIEVDTDGTYNFAGGVLSGQARLTSADLILASDSSGGAFELRGPNNTLTGDIGANQSINLLATGFIGGSSAVTTIGDVTNNGSIRTTAACCNGSNTTITVPDGNILLNAGSLDLSASVGVQTINGDFTNQATLTVGRNTSFNKIDGAYTNTGNATVSDAANIKLDNGADFFQDDGTLELQGTATVDVPMGSSFFFNGGDISGTGDVILTDAALVIGPGSDGTGRFRFRRAENTLTGTVSPAQTVILHALGNNGQNDVVTSTGDFINAGLVRSESGCCNGSNTTIVVPDGSTFTNLGTTDFSAPFGTQTVAGDMSNQGSLNIGQTTAFNKPGGLYANSGAVTIESGGSINLSNGASFSLDGGTITLQDDTANVFVTEGGTFFHNGGSIDGDGRVALSSSSLVVSPGVQGNGTFAFILSDNMLTGDIGPAQTIRIEASGVSGQNGTVTTTGDVTNAGTILMLSGCCAGSTTSLIVPDGNSLTNTGSLIIKGIAGARNLTFNLDNQGLLSVEHSSQLNKSDGVYANRGTILILGGKSLTVTGNKLTNMAGGVITGSGTLNVTDVAFNNRGTVAPGDGVGTLTVSGIYNQGPSGSLDVQLARMGGDRLAVNGAGTVNLDGTLNVSLLNGFVPQPADEFTIVTGSTINGTFANAPADPKGIGTVYFEGGSCNVVYSANSVVITNFLVSAPVPETPSLGSTSGRQ